MKNKILFYCAITILVACKKAETKQSVNTWVAGSWKRDNVIDTIFSGNTIYGIDYIPVNYNPNTLTFTTNTTGTSLVYGNFTYSLSTNAFTDATGNVYIISRPTTTTLELNKRASGHGYGDFYIKQ